MGFQVAHDTPQTTWCQMLYTDTLYVGQLVRVTDEGARPMAQASGVGDQTNANLIRTNNIPFGVVIGTNNKTPLFSTNYNAEYITSASPLASTNEYVGVEGVWPKGGREAMVKVALIHPSTVLRGTIFRASNGTALQVGSTTAGNGSSAGTSVTTTVSIGRGGSTGITKTFETVYNRTGANQGSYRVLDSNSSTALTWDTPLYSPSTLGDTWVAVNGLRPFGFSHMQVDSEAMFIDGSADASANYFSVNVIRLDLTTQGSEYAEFCFGADSFTHNTD